MNYYHIIILLAILFSIYYFFFIDILEENKELDINDIITNNIDYLKKYYLINNSIKEYPQSLQIKNSLAGLSIEDKINLIENIANKYQQLGLDVPSLKLNYEILKIRCKILPDKKNSIINILENLMTLNSNIGNKYEARNMFIKSMKLRGFSQQ